MNGTIREAMSKTTAFLSTSVAGFWNGSQFRPESGQKEYKGQMKDQKHNLAHAYSYASLISNLDSIRPHQSFQGSSTTLYVTGGIHSTPSRRPSLPPSLPPPFFSPPNVQPVFFPFPFPLPPFPCYPLPSFQKKKKENPKKTTKSIQPINFKSYEPPGSHCPTCHQPSTCPASPSSGPPPWPLWP